MTTRRRRRIRAWALGLLPLLALALLAVALRERGSSAGAQASSDRPGPVLLVAGYGGSTGALERLAQQLRGSGRTVVVVPPVGDNTGDLRAQAQALDRAVRAQLAAGAPSVDLVGYSAGGVVVRLWAADLDGAAVARRVVTLGSPHHGTDVAGLAAGLLAGACPTACRQLAPGSEVLAGLPEAVPGPRWTSIWTADDQTVTPPVSARLEGAVDIELQQVCPDERVSHAGLPTDPLAVALVRLALDGPAPAAAPTPDRCAALRASGSGAVSS